MLSGKLVRLIETNQHEITDRFLRDLQLHPDFIHLRRLPEAELRERGQVLLENLGYWLAAGNQDEIANKYEAVGKLRFEEAMPLHECVHAICLIKQKVIDYVSEQGFQPDALELYAEEELGYRLGRLFDLLIIRLVRGYETAWHKAGVAAAAMA